MADSDTRDAASLTYADSGVDYDALDSFKVACQREAAATTNLLHAHGMKEAAGTRGESAYLMETPTGYLAHVEEGLGTKNLVADRMHEATGQCYYKNVGIDTVATIVNDLATVGCLPACVAMHAAVGDSAWFNDRERAAQLAAGFAEGCRQAGAVWGGGETPALADIENRILNAGNRAQEIETRLFGELSAAVLAEHAALAGAAAALAAIDVAVAGAALAREADWARPRVDDSR
ncbi:MAG: AIR synthase related protein, partial [Planctomycetota bacterium]